MNGAVPRDVIQWKWLTDEADLVLDLVRGGLESPSRSRSGPESRSASRSTRRCSTRSAPATTTASSASSTSCRPACGEPVPQGRRLPAELPLRELHHAHPVHRGRPRAGRHRGPVAAERQHPRHRPRRAGRRCSATGGARRACAGCGPCSTTASRSTARSWCARASTTATCSTTRWPASSTEYPELASLCVVPLGVSRYNTEPAMRPHTTAEAAAVVDAVEDWQDVVPRGARPPAGVRRRRVLPAGRASVPRRPRPTRASPMHEDGIGMARTFELEFTGDATERRPACRPGSSPGSTARRPVGDEAAGDYDAGRGLPRGARESARRDGARRQPVAAVAAPRRAGRHPHRRVRGARVLGPLVDVARPRRRARDPGREPLLRRQHRRSPA